MNIVILQGFEWNLENDGQHWLNLKNQAQAFKDMGIDMIWLPPAYKGSGGSNDVGYGAYDLYDLGEFDQKGSIRTKYGTRQEYLDCIAAFHAVGINIMVDIVLNHKLGADQTESIQVKQVNDDDRGQEGETKTIEAWTKFDFVNRQQKYSAFTWNHSHFSGTDYDEATHKKGIYLIEGKQWDGDVDKEHFNYDYLMGADVDFNNEEVLVETAAWGEWYLDLTQADGVRLDAVKHIKFGFYKEWLAQMRKNRNLMAIGEYWSGDLKAIHNYLNEEGYAMSIFDVGLHYNFFNLSDSDGNGDISRIFDGTLVENNPNYAITFVDNHDTQQGQSLQSEVLAWMKPLAYALILLREAGTPCLFYKDMEDATLRETLATMTQIRKQRMAGQKYDYFDDPDIIGWSYTGDVNQPETGFVCIMSDRGSGEKRIFVGQENQGRTYVNALPGPDHDVVIDSDGSGVFPVDAGSVAVYVKKSSQAG